MEGPEFTKRSRRHWNGMNDRPDRKTCEEAFRRLDDFLDRRLSPDETRLVEEHLRICDACTREFSFEASVLSGIKQKLRHLNAPPDLVARILGQLVSHRAGQGN
jgi:anti-sigma factor (TIGR02949 family)